MYNVTLDNDNINHITSLENLIDYLCLQLDIPNKIVTEHILHHTVIHVHHSIIRPEFADLKDENYKSLKIADFVYVMSQDH